MSNEFPPPRLISDTELEESRNSTHRGYGSVAELLPTLEANDFHLPAAFDVLGIDTVIGDKVIDRMQTGIFRVIDGESLASDLEVTLPANLVDQRALYQGRDVCKVHFNLLNSFDGVFRKTKQDEAIKQQVWLWEIGRYAGRLLHKEIVFKQYPIGFPPTFASTEFWHNLSDELLPDRPFPETLPDESHMEHLNIALPERVASTFAKHMLVGSGNATEEQMDQLFFNLHTRALRPVRNAREFGANIGEVSLEEVGATTPLSNEEFKAYLEYGQDVSNVAPPTQLSSIQPPTHTRQ